MEKFGTVYLGYDPLRSAKLSQAKSSSNVSERIHDQAMMR